MKDEDYARTVIPHLKREYFGGHSQKVFDLFDAYIKEYNRRPTPEALNVEAQTTESIREQDLDGVFSLLEKLAARDVTEDGEWLIDKTELYCKESAINLAIVKSMSIIEGDDKQLDRGSIPKILQDAISLTFDTSVGHDYIEDADARFEYYHRKENKLAFDLGVLNDVTHNGVGRKTLNMLMAPPHAGKTLGMCHLAAAYMMLGYNVLYITMEMAEEKISERIDANLFNTPLDDVPNLGKDVFGKKIGKIKSKSVGKLVVKEYPTGGAHSGHFRALINELKMKKNMKPDVVFVDYLNICASARLRGVGGAVNTYSLVKSIAEELRGLAVEFEIAIWSATQVNRDGTKASDYGMTETSESFALPATCDLLWALIITDELLNQGQLMIKQLKNRYRDMNDKLKFIIGVDRSKMRWYELENSSPMHQDQSVPSRDQNSFVAKSPPDASKYSGFKM